MPAPGARTRIASGKVHIWIPLPARFTPLFNSLVNGRGEPIRPSNARIRHLEAENSRLRGMLDERQQRQQRQHRQSSDSIPPQLPTRRDDSWLSDDENDDAHSSASLASAPWPSGTPCRPPVRRDDADDGHHPPCRPPELSSTDKHPGGVGGNDEELIKNQLLTQATKQRQLEPIHAAQGKLDFEGLNADAGTKTLAKFWDSQTYAGSIVYRPAFMRDMSTADGGRYFSKLLLNAMLFSGSQKTAEIGHDEPRGQRFRRRFDEILLRPGTVFKSDVTTIQALLVMSDALFTWCDESSLSWHYMGLSINMMIDLGMHTESTVFRPRRRTGWEETEIRRRVFWAAFSMDKVQSIYLGHPPRLRETDSCVPIRFLDEYQELEPFHASGRSRFPTEQQLSRPSYSLSTFEQQCRLSIITDRMLSLYAEAMPKPAAHELMASAEALHAQLKRWKSGMPVHLLIRLEDPTASTILPHTLSLMQVSTLPSRAMYDALMILLYRPFVSGGHLGAVSESAARQAFAHCASAAIDTHRTLQLYRQHFGTDTTPYSISYAAYVSATIHVRMAAQSAPGSPAHERLGTCLDTLRGQKMFGRAPERTLRILRGLAARMGVHLGGAPNSKMPETGADGPQAPPRTEPLLSTSDDRGHGQTATLASDVAHDSPELDIDAIMSDLDIDDIMRSFDLEPPSGTAAQSTIDPHHQYGGFGIAPFSDLASDRCEAPPMGDDLFFPDLLCGFDLEME
ncbi:Pfam:BB1 [Geosmithia morbida]|uniref:Pfam:BB1 n=1 Tax=Geosmithia morbida TaxID=1094350 RepID=A0A9P4YP75_9HYPO|nr:Pfam:BB1 [Geosmithia morbida]KAF4120593.1 Pfam:BB1 [Geosmithia morbida]